MGHAIRTRRLPPRWRLPYKLTGSVMILAPTWSEWNLAKGGGSGAPFVSAYIARLDALGTDNIASALEALGLSGTLVLCCFEPLAGIPPEEQKYVCHRRAFADFWTREPGDPVPELSLGGLFADQIAG